MISDTNLSPEASRIAQLAQPLFEAQTRAELCARLQSIDTPQRTAVLEHADKAGQTLLLHHTYWGREELVDELIKQGSDTQARNKQGMTAMAMADGKRSITALLRTAAHDARVARESPTSDSPSSAAAASPSPAAAASPSPAPAPVASPPVLFLGDSNCKALRTGSYKRSEPAVSAWQVLALSQRAQPLTGAALARSR